MKFHAKEVPVESITRWRGLYRHEMSFQIIHDSIHSRPGWAKEFVLMEDGVGVGYGSLAVGGPWKDRPAIFEFFVLPSSRNHLFDHFAALVNAAGANKIETQSNDPLLTAMLHAFARDVASESILFHDRITTHLAPVGAKFRVAAKEDGLDISADQLPAHGVVEVEGKGGKVAGKGGILFHYNRPYGDIYMDVEEGFRKRGLGSFLVQELKRLCYQLGSVPSARCNPKNIASRKTLQKAGFVPCGHILVGTLVV